MFAFGDIITGIPENGYGLTTRGVVCRVTGSEDVDGDIIVEIINVDEELLKESRSPLIKLRREVDRYIGHTFVVRAEKFEYYEPKSKLADLSDALVDFVNSI